MAPASKGRIVLVKMREMGEPKIYNGSDEHPAVVTAVLSDSFINVRVLVDGTENPPWLTSVAHQEQAGPDYGGSTWRWPPRVES